jgi:hypothetical protein
MSETNFTWIDTHYKIAEYLSEKEDKQKGLIQLLKSIGIGPFNDKSKEGKEYDIDLEEIDPFTFFCYLHKYSSTRLTYKGTRGENWCVFRSDSATLFGQTVPL